MKTSLKVMFTSVTSMPVRISMRRITASRIFCEISGMDLPYGTVTVRSTAACVSPTSTETPRVPLGPPVTLPKNSPRVGELSPGRVVPRPAISGSAPRDLAHHRPGDAANHSAAYGRRPAVGCSGLPRFARSSSRLSPFFFSPTRHRIAYPIFTRRLRGSHLAVWLRQGSAVGRPLR